MSAVQLHRSYLGIRTVRFLSFHHSGEPESRRLRVLQGRRVQASGGVGPQHGHEGNLYHIYRTTFGMDSGLLRELLFVYIRSELASWRDCCAVDSRITL